MNKNENQLGTFCFCENNKNNMMTKKLFADKFYSSIIESVDFQRLQNVSFLGAIDYVSSEKKYTRYQHSLDVANLALYVSEIRDYTKEVTDLLVSSALLHDIGHAPFSHSMEPSFFSNYGINHHLASREIITGCSENKAINSILKKNTDVALVLSLIEQKSNEEFSDVFNSKINIDTIDGIHKSLAFVNILNGYDKYALVESAFLNNVQGQVSRLDDFWAAKDFVYKKIITSGIGAIADHISKEYFFDNLKKLNCRYFYKPESALLKGRTPIFKHFTNRLKGISPVNDLGEHNYVDTKQLNVSVTERNYTTISSVAINEYGNIKESINNRYIIEKRKARKNIFYKMARENHGTIKQLNLFG